MIIRLRSIAELMCKHHIILIEMCNLLLRFSSFLLERVWLLKKYFKESLRKCDRITLVFKILKWLQRIHLETVCWRISLQILTGTNWNLSAGFVFVSNVYSSHFNHQKSIVRNNGVGIIELLSQFFTLKELWQ